MKGYTNPYVTQEEFDQMIKMVEQPITPERQKQLDDAWKLLNAHPEIEIIVTD
ncbi:hypothetical protein FC18_GL000621 [Lacticaseibacillus sharpeae JCM 1186 = DSM 20505]|uniref:Uncharacterized protein n=1 Tax=Lacticaseibacillus sharpeae JCM 1186 = DSM 20505 TaxID=1291052 RepID=A0A0R1ZIV8_9LACO|nr:hypothetical protein FC18_GL000621 [Lacticaseibacillus sharpeae JCM 1186 = DSM 20505]